MSSLVDLESKDSKTFWNVINKFKNGEAEQNDPSSNISPDEWHSYFNNLLSVRVEECDYEIGIATLKIILMNILLSRKLLMQFGH